MSLTWLATELRRAGLTVVEHAGWQTRAVAGAWSPRFGVVHATAAPRTQDDDTQVRIVRDGREGLRGPIANACVDRAGRWHVLSGGRCNTTIAGTAGPYEGWGNTYALGVEACNDNAGEAWPDVQYRAYVRGWAAIARRMGWAAERLRGHKEHTPGHKTDPTFDMASFRRDVAAVLAGEDDDMLTDADQPIIRAAVHSTQIGKTGVTIAQAIDSLRPLPASVALLTTEVTALRAVVEQLAAAIAAGGGTVDTAAILAGVDERLAAARADLRDAVADLGEGGAEQVRGPQG